MQSIDPQPRQIENQLECGRYIVVVENGRLVSIERADDADVVLKLDDLPALIAAGDIVNNELFQRILTSCSERLDRAA